MMRKTLICILALLAAAAPDLFAQQHDAAFSFSAGSATGVPAGWAGGPAETLGVDTAEFRSAPSAGRLHRTASSPSEASALTFSMPVTFSGSRIELRGWLRTEDVTGFAGLWLRQDGPAGPVQFDNMQDRGPKGTTPWTEYRITLPLDSRAQSIYVGAIAVGTGTVWVDDLELLVDGRPFTEAPARESASTAISADDEFDAGSGIATAPLSDVQVANVALLGRVWGFVKYHHPTVTAGDVHWDYELFRALPGVLEATDRRAATDAIATWLERLGAPESCDPCATLPDEAHLVPELDWIRDTQLLDTTLSTQLQNIHRNRSTAAAQHYRGAVPGVGNPDFSNEDSYAALGHPDAGYRLLALFRFWNIIEYWFPYRDIIGEDWNAVLTEFVPVMMAADDAATYQLELMRLSARINDTHANVWRSLALRPPRGAAMLPVEIRYVEGVPVVTAYTHAELGPASGLRPGDIVERLDGVTIDELIEPWLPYYSASNEVTRLRDIARTLTRGEPGPVRVAVRRDDSTIELTINRVPITELDASRAGVHDLPGETFRMLSDDVAYLKLSSVKNADVPDYISRAADAEVLVVDIRNYPSEFVVFTLGGRLTDAPVPFARFTRGDPANPGAFIWTDPVTLRPLTPRFDGKVVVLVDETSVSQAEYTAMALRATPNAIVVGSTTAAADGNVSPIPLPGGAASMITGIGVFYPDRTPTQRIGIVPDVEVRPTIEGIRAGRDEVLEAAVSRALGREFRLRKDDTTRP